MMSDRHPEVAGVIRAALVEDGYASARVGELPIEAADWRRVARSVARGLKRTIQTGEFDGRVFASLTDFPRDAEEEARHAARMRAAYGKLRLSGLLGPSYH